MKLSDDTIRIIFGLKLRQLRTDKKLSLAELSSHCDLSISYLNEIEKGKKYPKASKIMSLAQALDTPYDELVSLKLDKKLAPIGKLLKSSFLDELPLELFGIETNKLIEIISNAPAKVNAFISTLLEISRNYNLSQEHFYFTALRSYQELYENYFEEIETEAQLFAEKIGYTSSAIHNAELLEKILTTEYNYRIIYESFEQYPEISHLRFAYFNGNPNILRINERLDDFQRAFVLARQLGVISLKLKYRAYSSPMLTVDSFEQVLGNFKSSYFAGALLINEKRLVADMSDFFAQTEWNPDLLLQIMYKYTSSPDMFMQRLSNLLPAHFGLSNLFFIRMKNKQETDYFYITKELHFSQLHSPHANGLEQHYCRRWGTVRVLNEIEDLRTSGQYKGAVVNIQTSHFLDSDKAYLVLSIGRTMVSSADTNYSVGIGFLLSDEMKKQIAFWDSPTVATETVNQTCESCSISDCSVRAAAPIHVQRRNKERQVIRAFNALKEDIEAV